MRVQYTYGFGYNWYFSAAVSDMPLSIPKFTWGLSLLLLLAALATLAAPVEPMHDTSNMTQVARWLHIAWHDAQEQYQAKICNIILSRMQEYKEQNAGYGEVGIYLEEVGSGFVYDYMGERSQLRQNGEYAGYFHTASVAKLLMAYVCYYLDDQGEIDIEHIHMDPIVGQRQQLQPLLHRMLTHSVNLHYNILLRYLGSEKTNQTLQELGLNQSRLSRELGWAPGTADAT